MIIGDNFETHISLKMTHLSFKILGLFQYLVKWLF